MTRWKCQAREHVVPQWVGDIGDLREFVLEAHGLSINAPKIANRGQDVHIGIIDSLFTPPKEHFFNENIVNKCSFIDADIDETNPRGGEIFRTTLYL